VVVEELLKTLVGVVDAHLLKAIHSEDFKARDVEDTDKVHAPGFGFQSVVDAIDKPLEQALVQRLGESVDCELDLPNCLLDSDDFRSGTHARLEQRLDEFAGADTEQMSHLLGGYTSTRSGLVSFATCKQALPSYLSCRA
jgi:hypothetical protein